MAFLILKNKSRLQRYKVVPHDVAVMLWSVKTGEIEATPELQAKADMVQRIYLPYDSAPQSYRELYPRKSDDDIVSQKHWTKKYD